MTTLQFDRERLPRAVEYFQRAGLRLIGRGPWRSALCCFHDEQRPSLRINVETGAYRCMACGARGGDLVDFHRARHGLSFRAALVDLGVLQ